MRGEAADSRRTKCERLVKWKRPFALGGWRQGFAIGCGEVAEVIV